MRYSPRCCGANEVRALRYVGLHRREPLARDQRFVLAGDEHPEPSIRPDLDGVPQHAAHADHAPRASTPSAYTRLAQGAGDHTHARAALEAAIEDVAHDCRLVRLDTQMAVDYAIAVGWTPSTSP